MEIISVLLINSPCETNMSYAAYTDDYSITHVDSSRPRTLPLYIQILHIQSMLLDELSTRLDLISHQNREHLIRLYGILDSYL